MEHTVEYIKRNIDQQIAREQWNLTEWDDKRDLNADDRRIIFNERTFKVDLVQLDEEDFNNIILPAHAHKYVNCGHEQTLENLVKRFEKKLPDPNNEDDCQDRINHIIDHFNYSNSDIAFLQGKFMFITKNVDLAVNNQYQHHGYFTGSFHQFAAYALWIVINRFMPLRLYLIE